MDSRRVAAAAVCPLREAVSDRRLREGCMCVWQRDLASRVSRVILCLFHVPNRLCWVHSPSLQDVRCHTTPYQPFQPVHATLKNL